MKILVAGDFCPRTRTAKLIEESKFDIALGQIKPIVENCDYSIVNLECPIIENDSIAPIKKFGGSLKCKSQSIDAIKYAGFKGVTLANNHILDYGYIGVKNTISLCHETGLDFVGAGRNIEEASKTLFKIIEDKTIAFINCCEHEFSIATKENAGSNPLNPIQQYYDIKEAQKNADYVIVIIHGGHEHFQLPSPRMKEVYRFFVDCGADIVINHHQHCFSGYEIYKDSPIFYGLGNFYFNKDNSLEGIWNEGYLLEINIKDNITFSLIPYIQCGDSPDVHLMKDLQVENFFKSISKLNDIIQDDAKLVLEYESWMNLNSSKYDVLFSPFDNRIIKALIKRHYIPYTMSNQKVLEFFNNIECESQRERIVYYLKNKFDKCYH